ncbi:MAG TPA: sulfotransferase domain-containing protein [Bacillales bacterium]|nr:sulfotransferase domain-containing protein [Bacillales bacterium]
MNDIERGPDFLIMGAMKSGTTSLYKYLCQHPDVIPAKEKELQFFSKKFNKGLPWYKSQFPLLSNSDQSKITGEGDPYYMFHPHGPRRIYETLPHVKLMVLLRNPTDRAFSHYNYIRRRVKMPFDKALQAELKHIEKEKQKMLEDEHYISAFYRDYSFLSRGKYIEQLEAMEKYFDRNQILVLISEELFEDPQKVMSRVFPFLNIPGYKIDRFPVFNNRNYKPMKEATRTFLKDYFQPYNQRLYRYLGKDLSWE